MVVLGLGLGSVMQVLVLVVQNAVAHSLLGVATSGATLFRSSRRIDRHGDVRRHLRQRPHREPRQAPAGHPPAQASFSAADATPALLGKLQAAVHAGFVAGYAESIQTVFLVAVPIAALAFIATWFIPQVELKQWPEPNADATPTDTPMAVADASVSAEVLDQPGTSPVPARNDVYSESLDPQGGLHRHLTVPLPPKAPARPARGALGAKRPPATSGCATPSLPPLFTLKVRPQIRANHPP